MTRMLILSVLLLLVSACATVGGVTVEEDDTLFTIGTAFTLAVGIFLIKASIEYLFAKRLERYKHSLKNTPKD